MSQNKPAASEGAKLSAGEKNEAASPKAGAGQAGAGHTGAKGPHAGREAKRDAAPRENAEFLRAENEDDDGYDPYSDRRPSPEPLFERDPWD